MKVDHRKIGKDSTESACLRVPVDEVLDDYTVQTLGPQPEVPDPPEEPDTSDEEAKFRATEEELAKHPSTRQLTGLLVGLFVVEVLGCILLMDSLGLENPWRTVFGLMCAGIIFLLTYLVAQLTRNAGAPGSAGLPSKNRWRAMIYGAYVIFIIAITVLRLDEMDGGDDSSFLTDLSMAIVLTCLTMGIAWIADMVMNRLVPLIPTVRTRALHARRIANAKRQHERALEGVRRAEVRRKEWKDAAEELQATYRYRNTIVDSAITGRAPVASSGGNGAVKPKSRRPPARPVAVPQGDEVPT